MECNITLDNTTKEKEKFDSEYKRGFNDGLESANKRCLENGFRDGVQLGVETGYHLGYLSVMKRVMNTITGKVEENNNEKLVQRVNNLLEKTEKYEETQDLDEFKRNQKILTSSLKQLSKKINGE